jgi:hypothetical protein
LKASDRGRGTVEPIDRGGGVRVAAASTLATVLCATCGGGGGYEEGIRAGSEASVDVSVHGGTGELDPGPAGRPGAGDMRVYRSRHPERTAFFQLFEKHFDRYLGSYPVSIN